MTTRLFPMGQLLATPGAKELLEQNGLSAAAFIQRHVSGDWGDLDPEDKALNDEAVKPATQSRVMSAYNIGSDKLWIITEWDRSATTLLLPSEY